jgi:uncharacterized protein (TIGR00251 family)
MESSPIDCPVRCEERDGALFVDVQVVPRASRVAVGPAVGDRLRVAVTAPPVDGAANAAVIEAVAAAFCVRRSAVEIARGAQGRRKTVRIAGATREALARLLASR